MRRSSVGSACSLLVAASCSAPAPEAPAGLPGEPLPGLSETELAAFQRGRALFDHGWSQEEGLGPLYLQDRCSSCHDLPALGGAGVELLPLATRWDPSAGCDPLTGEGGPLRQLAVTPLGLAAGVAPEATPGGATELVMETAPLLFGLGLIEAIPESVVEGMADPDDADGDGISGRVNRTPDGRLGRLSRKADVASIRDLVEAALVTELGITSARYPEEEKPGGRPLPPEADPAPDPEIGEKDILALVDFIRFLAPPAPEVPASPAALDSLEEGARLFRRIGCASCHVPTLVTGPNPVPALSEKSVHLYSDLLLHDLGPDVRSICSGDVSPTEVRTARLMGLRLREPYAVSWVSPSLERRVLAHGGEAEAARRRYEQLTADARSRLLRFLLSL